MVQKRVPAELSTMAPPLEHGKALGGVSQSKMNLRREPKGGEKTTGKTALRVSLGNTNMLANYPLKQQWGGGT